MPQSLETDFITERILMEDFQQRNDVNIPIESLWLEEYNLCRERCSRRGELGSRWEGER